MRVHPYRRLIVTLILCALALAAVPAGAVTYLSVEPVPNVDVVGQTVLDNLLALDVDLRARWAELLLGCGLVQDVIDALASDGTITTVNGTNTFFGVAAGGFEGQTNPTYVSTIVDSGVNAVSGGDLETLANALGYVLSQGGIVHFNPDDGDAHDFSLDYVTLTFASGPPDAGEAQELFAHVGTVDEELFTGLFAGYTQVGAALLFLQPAVDTQRFVDGMFEAASTFPGVEYGPLDMAGDPTTAPAGVAFRGNDWLVDPEGRGYLDNVGQDPSADLGKLPNLDDLRSFHLFTVRLLSRWASRGRFEENGFRVLDRIFRCER